MQVLQRKISSNPDSAADTRIWIVGSNGLQNYLLSEYIETKTGFPCGYRSSVLFEPAEKQSLMLYDCFGVELPNEWTKFESFFNASDENMFLAFFNVNPDGKFEREFVERGIRGVFYISESPDVLSKGAEAILNGELWYSRKTTSLLLQNTIQSSKVIQMAKTGLTTREKEILLAIAAGAANIDIAEKLHISPHTVKNHIYNIYRKIKVKSRLEAILWVTKYL